MLKFTPICGPLLLMLASPAVTGADEIDILIQVDTSGQVKVDGTPMTLDEVQTKFDTIFKKEDECSQDINPFPCCHIHLHADSRTHCHRVFDALSRLSEAARPYLIDHCSAYPYVDVSGSALRPFFVCYPGLCTSDFKPGGKLYGDVPFIFLRASGEVVLDTLKVKPAELRRLVKAEIDHSLTRKAVILADWEVPWRKVLSTAQTARKMGAGEIYLYSWMSSGVE